MTRQPRHTEFFSTRPRRYDGFVNRVVVSNVFVLDDHTKATVDAVHYVGDAKWVSRVYTVLVLHVYAVWNTTQVGPSVVRFVAVDMVYRIVGVHTCHYRPCHAVFEQASAISANYAIAVLSNMAGTCSCCVAVVPKVDASLVAIAFYRARFMCKNAGFGVIIEQRPHNGGRERGWFHVCGTFWCSCTETYSALFRVTQLGREGHGDPRSGAPRELRKISGGAA